jgi:hypothetical protein
MATLKERSDNWKATSLTHRDHRHDKGDGYEETPHRKTAKRKKVNKHEGCPGNDNGPHIYVWARETRWKPVWNWNGWFWSMGDYEYNTCAGCYKHKRLRRKGVAPLR